MRKRAIVTLAVGVDYRNLWRRCCRANWEEYAARHEADLICYEEPLDDSARAKRRGATWQKLLILGQSEVRGYEQVVWLDADVLLNPQAEWVGDGVPAHLVGATDEYEYPTRELYRRALAKLYRIWETQGAPYAYNLTPEEFYRVSGFDRVFDRVVQAGMFVASPEHHREIFERVYYDYEERESPVGGEMRPLSYELLMRNLVHWLEPHKNALWMIEKQLRYPFLFAEPNHPLLGRCATKALSENSVLHFAGSGHDLAFVVWDGPEMKGARTVRTFTLPDPKEYGRCETAVAVLLFNRPDTTKKVMEAVRAARPIQLFLIADGPRAEMESDTGLCAEARAVALDVDWDCEVVTNFAEGNLGLKRRVENGLDWLFEQVERAIILEDDCVPQPSFFPFCEELLERYEDDERIMMVSGCDFKFGLTEDENSYTFSRYPLIWGWATWRRAWRKNDPDMMSFPSALGTDKLEELLKDPLAAQYWEYTLNEDRTTKTTWDRAWLWTIWEHGGLCIHPNVNLVENIGFGAEATHTKAESDLMSELLTEPMPFPLKHPREIVRDERGDELLEENAFSGSLRRLWRRVSAERAARRKKELVR